MNKLLFVLLAVCLVSVHAFVKRDAPAPTNDNTLQDLPNKLKELGEDLGTKIKEALDPEVLKQKLGEFIDSANNAIKDIQAKQKPAA